MVSVLASVDRRLARFASDNLAICQQAKVGLIGCNLRQGSGGYDTVSDPSQYITDLRFLAQDLRERTDG